MLNNRLIIILPAKIRISEQKSKYNLRFFEREYLRRPFHVSVFKQSKRSTRLGCQSKSRLTYLFLCWLPVLVYVSTRAQICALVPQFNRLCYLQALKFQPLYFTGNALLINRIPWPSETITLPTIKENHLQFIEFFYL
jgi:hypothetical protein